MKIYDSLKDVLSSEQLKAFKAEVKETISEAVLTKTLELEEKAEEYTELMVEKKVEELTVKAEEYIAIQLDEKSELLVADYDEKIEELETNVVESLDRFLDNEISENISDTLLESVAEQQALLPLVDGLKTLFEEHYVAIDTDGSRMIAKAQNEKEDLEDQLSEALAQKIELSELAEKAATKLLVSEKTEDLTIGEQSKVKSFFEDKDFDEVSKKIDGYISLISEDEDDTTETDTLNEAVASEDDGFRETEPSNINEDDLFLSQASHFLV
jgi:hypothetical protein